MHIYFILLIVVCAGIIAIALILLNEQRAGKIVVKKLALQEEANKYLKTQNDKLAARIEELIKSNQVLKDSIDLREEAMVKEAKTLNMHKLAEVIERTPISEIMSKEIVSVRVDAHFSEVARKMKEFDIRHLPVVDADNKLVGFITQRMLYQIRSPRKLMDGEWYYDEEMLDGVILSHVMAKEVVSFYPDQSIGKVIMKMTYTKWGGIPIVDYENKLVGIVTRTDILKFAAGIYQKKYG